MNDQRAYGRATSPEAMEAEITVAMHWVQRRGLGEVCCGRVRESRPALS